MTITLDGTAGITTPTETTTGNSSVGGNLTVAGTASITGNTTVTGTFTATGGVTGSIRSGTAVASTSGTSIDFTSIPSGVKRITVMFNGVSTNGASNVQIQIGSGSFTTTGYVSASANISGTVGAVSSTTGFVVYAATSADSRNGQMIITNITGNTWVSAHSMANGASAAITGAGNLALSGTLDRVRVTTVNGTDTFDAGTINILYE